MKLKNIVTGLSITAATLMGAASVNASDLSEVAYKGDSRAVGICRAIIEDNAHEVKSQLNQARRDHPGVVITMSSKDAFQCNGKSLEDFARETGAGKALAYLDGSSNGAVAQN